MIIDALLKILKALVQWVIATRPPWEVHLPQGVTQTFSMLKGFDAILPVSETLACILLIVGLLGVFSTVKWSIKIIDWIADVIP